jgi:hypothetical protein
MTGVTRTSDAERPIGEWNRYEIVLERQPHHRARQRHEGQRGDRLEVLAGPVGLQSEGGEIHFRTVELTPIR